MFVPLKKQNSERKSRREEVKEMENAITTIRQDEAMGTLIDHPIVEFYEQEVSQEIKMCSCDDCDPCDYEAR